MMPVQVILTKFLGNDVTIATCWDADRLDLIRIGIKTRLIFFEYRYCKKIAQNMNHDIPKYNV